MSDADDVNRSQTALDVASLLPDWAGRWVLDPASCRVEFHVEHFWHAVTVHGVFDRVGGEGTVAPDGSVSGRLMIDAVSLNTKNSRRDQHLRSAEFFDVEHHPQVVVTVSSAEPAGGGAVTCHATLQAAGFTKPVAFTARVATAMLDAVAIRAELVVDRSEFGMTWSPLRMASMRVRATVAAQFVRS